MCGPGCIDGLVELRDARGFELIAGCARYGAFAQSRAAAVGALGRLGEFFPERKRTLGEQIADFLRDPDFRVRIAAANALKTLKDDSQAGALEQMAARELDGRAVRIARENAGILRKGADTASEVKALREEFERLRDENAKLKDRLDRARGAAAGDLTRASTPSGGAVSILGDCGAAVHPSD